MKSVKRKRCKECNAFATLSKEKCEECARENEEKSWSGDRCRSEVKDGQDDVWMVCQG